MQYLFVAAGTLIVFLIILILSKEIRTVSDNTLVVWLLVYLSNILTVTIVTNYSPPFKAGLGFLIEFSESSLFLHGPLLYIYTLSLTKPGFKLSSKYFPHFILFIISYLYLITGLFAETGTNGVGRDVQIVVKLIAVGFYLFYNIDLLKKHSRNIENIFSNTASRTLHWLKFITIGLIIVWIIGVISLLLFYFLGFPIPQYGGLYINMAMCIFVFLLGYFGFKQASIFSVINNEERSEDIVEFQEILEDQPVKEIKYRKSGLDQAKSEEIDINMLSLLQEKRIYLDQNLTLFKLAKTLGVPPNHLSQVINSHHSQNFFNFINSYRIREVKEILNSGRFKNLSLLGIAFECGFNSKASFNRAFKKETGLTPSEFKKQN